MTDSAALPDSDSDESPAQIRMQIFDIQGNRFVHPYYGYIDSGPDAGSPTELWAKSLMLRLALSAEVQPGEAGFLTLPIDSNGNFGVRHVKVDIASRAFMHGGAQFFCIEGPIFDRVVAEEAAETSPAQAGAV